MKKLSFYILLSIFSLSIIAGRKKKTKTKEINLFDNQILDEHIKTVEFYLSGGAGDVVDYPIKVLNGENPLVLEFDWMGDEEVPYMMAKILHCDYEWERSSLVEMDFIPDINEYRLSELDQSSMTNVNYSHTRFEVPNVKVSGNYILQIYNEDNPGKIYLTRRFIVFENKVKITSKIAYSSIVNLRFKNHQIDFGLNYSAVNSSNPVNDFQVAILQNGRWDNALVDILPTSVREDLKRLEYNYFSGENNFKAGNEYRSFDIRNHKAEGLGVERLEWDASPQKVKLYKDKPLTTYAYSDTRDMDGKFVISNFRGSDKTNSEYMDVDFRLEYPKQDKSIYVFGGLSDWKLKDEFKMQYDSINKIYKTTLSLKQGYYNYLYAVKENEKANTILIEGSHQQTQNTYIILIYYEEFGTYYDQVVGYKVVKE